MLRGFKVFGEKKRKLSLQDLVRLLRSIQKMLFINQMQIQLLEERPRSFQLDTVKYLFRILLSNQTVAMVYSGVGATFAT